VYDNGIGQALGVRAFAVGHDEKNGDEHASHDTTVCARCVRDPRPFLISLFIFVAWIVAATGWVRVLAVVWLIYPVFVLHRDAEERQGPLTRVHWRTLAHGSPLYPEQIGLALVLRGEHTPLDGRYERATDLDRQRQPA
jgi:hypothetical protein